MTLCRKLESALAPYREPDNCRERVLFHFAHIFFENQMQRKFLTSEFRLFCSAHMVVGVKSVIYDIIVLLHYEIIL